MALNKSMKNEKADLISIDQHPLRQLGLDFQAFHLPRWEELPAEPMMRKAFLDYIHDIFKPITDREVLTGTMVQNYIKWGLVPRPLDRKYTRIHLAYAIVISILKEIIHLENIQLGAVMQTKLMTTAQAYDVFAGLLEDALKRQSKFLLEPVPINQEIIFEPLKCKLENLNLAYICEAYSFKLLGERFIELGGFAYSLE